LREVVIHPNLLSLGLIPLGIIILTMENKLPESHLIQLLRKKASDRSDVVFDYIAKLEDLRSRIGGEVRLINALFPEYTPHDEEYHLSRLFHVADTLIGPSRYENMNATELFILACGLYGHDWGMAVSAVEREYIISEELPEGFSVSDFALLYDEHKGFGTFIKERGIAIEDIRKNGIDTEDWREYVRKTHAFRSGARIRQFFERIDNGIGEAGGRVCEGHWLNIEEIRNPHNYPINFAVLRENINLAALAVYVRLVDLFDLGHDRTPYVIWKFVAPRNRYSKMEWEKHRALQPITCPDYLNGRIVLFDGSTDDHEVYASLEDLRAYCEKQLRECTDLLAHLADPRHLLDLYHVEWRVVARGFDPVLVRFEFDRERVFEILSNEIYQGDPYVFLRELLQNSIDAIRVRREVLACAGIKPETFGFIEVKVEHGKNGDAVITWTDDGIGMDEYVVRNYLAVAGRSYYRSEDFEKEGFNLDPISRFGVGLLSCFMVANLVEIETRKDPYATTASGGLRIKIPAMTRQFRIERVASPDFEIGTRVKVFVEGTLLDTAQLDVSSYLKQIAGFVEFPIVISEWSVNTVLLHPKSQIRPSEHRQLKRYSNLNVHRTALEFPLSQALVFQDLEGAGPEIIERAFDLQEDLAMTTCEGRITYLDIRDKNSWIIYDNDYRYGAGIIISDADEKKSVHARWKRDWSYYGRDGQKQPISRSADAAASYSVFRDGVLIPHATLPREFMNRRGGESFPLPRMVINLINKDSTQLDLARVELRSGDTHWFDLINETLTNRLLADFNTDRANFAGTQALTSLGLFDLTYHLDARTILISMGETLPMAMLNSVGKFEVRRLTDFEPKVLAVCPNILSEELSKLILAQVSNIPYKGYLSNWRGDNSVIAEVGYLPDLRLANAIDLTSSLLENYYFLANVELLQPPKKGLPPLLREIWKHQDLKLIRPIESIASEAIEDPFAISALDRGRLLKSIPWIWSHKFIVVPSDGPPPFRVGTSIYNLRHPVGEALFRTLAWMLLNDSSSSEALNHGRMMDAAVKLLPYPDELLDSREATVGAQSLSRIANSVGLNVSSNLKIRPKDLWYQSKREFDRLARKGTMTFGEVWD
jgi:hypothetical protein